MLIATEPIGSIPRTPELIEATRQVTLGRMKPEGYQNAVDAALRDTIRRFEATGSPVISDGEQAKSSFVTYPLEGLTNLASDGVIIPFVDGHTRQLPRLTAGPFRYAIHAATYLRRAKALTGLPVKQAVNSASALSLLYPNTPIVDYPREQFEQDLVDEAETDIRQCLEAGAHSVQIDFTEGRLSLKLDPSGGLLRMFIELNNKVFARFSSEERAQIGVHTCPGGDRNSTHSASVDYAELLPHLFALNAGRFYIQLASEPEPERVLRIIQEHSKPDQFIFIGVVDPNSVNVESPEEIRRRIMDASAYIAPSRLGTTDDCGFAPFADDVSTSRDLAFEKIRARIKGTRLAATDLDP